MGHGSNAGNALGQGFGMLGKVLGGGQGDQPPAPSSAPPAGPSPLMKPMPGYSQPMPMFGNMSDADLAAYMAANGIRMPQGPGKRKPVTSGGEGHEY